MDGMRKLLAALVVLAAGIFWGTHGHAAAPIIGNGQAPGGFGMPAGYVCAPAKCPVPR
ncbi:MAG: hypothetical protein U1F10_02090 [Burkholderiales bacterium]